MGHVRSEAVMGTIVTIEIVRAQGSATESAMERAFNWFHEIETRCTRFDETSELMQLTKRVGVPVPVSPILFETIQFALMVAEESGGAFDPTMERRFRDILLDTKNGAITLGRPLTLDLGAVAKGLAVDLAARELQPFRDFAIDAGGDLYFGGLNPEGMKWRAGIQHPRRDAELLDVLHVSNQAVCTSGDYERGQHILDPRSAQCANRAASVTVVAPGAMLADALATAAFVLGPEEGIQFLERMDVDGLILTPDLERYETRGLGRAA